MIEHDDPEESLRSSIRFALQQFNFRRPKEHDPVARDRYFSSAADAVMKQIMMSGWTIERLVMKKHPPLK